MVSPSPFLRPRDRGRGGDRSSALLREQCVGKTQLVSKVRTNAFQIIWDLLTCLLGALAPRCPKGLYLPLPRSLWDPGLGGSRLCTGAPTVWPCLFCNLL